MGMASDGVAWAWRTFLELPLKGRVAAVVVVVALGIVGNVMKIRTDASPVSADGAHLVATERPYRIVSRVENLPHWRTYEIVLDRKVDEGTLRPLTLDLRDQAPDDVEVTSMLWYVRAEDVAGRKYWATTSFGPDFEVVIFGTTVAEDAKLLASADPAGADEVLGRWLFDDANKQLVVLYRKGQHWFEHYSYTDGGVGEDEVRVTKNGSTWRVDPVEPTGSGDYSTIREDGVLQEWDQDGLVGTISPTKGK